LLLATTDIRSQKVFQATSAPLSEISWWFPSSQVQFRIAARVHIVPAPDHSSYQHFSPLFKKLAPSNFDWESERQTRFNRMSPYMRASWARPAPRTLIPSYDEGRKWPTELPKIGQGDNETEQKNIEFALSNFALLLLDPYEVDYVELGVQPNQRTIYTRTDDEDGSWSETIVVP
jgi:pyridoxamine 5'-phosphate oxidase